MRSDVRRIGLMRALTIAVALGATACGATGDPAQPGDRQPGDQQPGDQQPGDQQPGDQQPGDQQPGDQQPGDGELRSAQQRISAPALAGDAFAQQIAASNAFALDLYQQARAAAGNVIYSPHSLSLALAMVYGGARGDTARQLEQALRFALPADELHAAFNKLDLELAHRGQGAQAADGGAFRLRVVNAAWGQTGYPFLPTYLDLLALNYGAGLRVLDFGQPEAARQTINGWVAQQTESRIKELIPKGAISQLTRLVLTNAVYFNAAWATPFDAQQTADEPFTRADGSAVQTAMMHGTQTMRYAAGGDFAAMELPYDGGELSMLVVVPAAGTFDAFEQALDGAKVDAILGQLAVHRVTAGLPRFACQAKLEAKQALIALGVTDLFDDARADLSGIDGQRELHVSDVLHKAFIEVNEQGTEATAATAVVVTPPSVPPPATLIADRPFVYLIRDHASGAILFVGRVVDPTA